MQVRVVVTLFRGATSLFTLISSVNGPTVTMVTPARRAW